MKYVAIGFAAGTLVLAATGAGLAQSTTIVETIDVAPPDEVITYGYAVINERRVLIQAGTRKVIRVLD